MVSTTVADYRRAAQERLLLDAKVGQGLKSRPMPAKVVDDWNVPMKIPPELVVHEAICTGITQVEGEPGVYIVNILFDGTPEVFHIELEGLRTSFNVREGIFYKYTMRCYPMKGLIPLMRQWHRGERRELPVDLAEVRWT
jgi:hypothetical protein